MSNFILEIGQKHYGQDIAVVSHGGPIRYGRGYFSGYRTENSILNYHIIKPGEKIDFIVPANPHTELDQWILSELQILLKIYREKMDAYKLDEALKPIPEFIDNLNNWFLRRSRKRFWAKEMTSEKISGYETLFQVLVTLSKILAPTCPFFAEKLYKDLTKFADNDASVHLRYLPISDEKLINKNLSKKIKTIREIVSLSAGIRARKKIKLRQPLAKISFSLNNKIELTDTDLEIIKEEANVKDVEILNEKEVSSFAKKIVKVDARKVGKKFGKKVQTLIIAGKNGKWTELKDGKIKIEEEILDVGEYEVSFLCEGDFEADSTTNVVVLLETEISEDLRIEGISREIIRAIQEKRKTDGFEISDRISVEYFTKYEDLKSAFTQFGTQISKEVLADNILENSGGDEVEIDGNICELKIEKI
jgi:isoleucyl-tRNA synthetase